MRRSLGKICGLQFALMAVSPQTVCGEPFAVRSISLPQPVNDIVWDSTRARFFVSSGTSVLIIDPEAALIEDDIAIGDSANGIAVSSDGRYLYVALGTQFESRGIVSRYRLQDRSRDAQIRLGQSTGGNIPRSVQAMVALPGQSLALVVATNDRRVAILDDTVPRNEILALSVSSFHVRPSDGALFALADASDYHDPQPHLYRLATRNNGVAIETSVPVDPHWNNGTKVTWSGNLAVSRNAYASYVFNLDAGATVGRLPVSPPVASAGACFLSGDASGTSAIAYQYQYHSSTTRLVQYSLPNFHPVASVDLTGIPPDDSSVASLCGSALTWGTDGILVYGNRRLFFLRTSGLAPLVPRPVPMPTLDTNGVIHLPLSASDLVFDAGRNLLWASIPGDSPASGNSVISINPASGKVIDTIDAGSEPGALALSSGGSHLFAALRGAPAISTIDLEAKDASVFSVLSSSSPRYWSAVDLAAMAGEGKSVVAVLRAGYGSSVVAYDAGVPRKEVFNSGSGANVYSQWVQTIFPGDADNTFFAANKELHNSDNSHDIHRLVVDSSGVKPGSRPNNLLLGSGSGAHGVPGHDQPVSIVHDAGRLFTSAGQIVTPDTQRILGSVALSPSYGLPVAFPDQNRVVYVQSFSPQVSAISYDLATLRPLSYVPLLSGPLCGCTSDTLSSVNVTAAVRVGKEAIAVAANGEIVIAPLARFQSWPIGNIAVQPVSAGVRLLNIPVNAIGAILGSR